MKNGSWKVAALAALPGLLIAGTQWVEAQAERERADAAKAAKVEIRESYGDYITDRLRRDEALEKALHSCMRMLHRPVTLAEAPPGILGGEPPAYAMMRNLPENPLPEQQSLDEVAAEFGYEETP